MTSIFWHRRDLRIYDNAALYNALKNEKSVQVIFIFDTNILSKLPNNDQRIIFIHQEIERLKLEYKNLGSDLRVYYGDPITIFQELIENKSVNAVYTNSDYEPYALDRDHSISGLLTKNNIAFIDSKDHVIFEKSEVVKDNSTPYLVFTPYSKKWKEKLNELPLAPYPVEDYLSNLAKAEYTELISLRELGFEENQINQFPSKNIPEKILKNYSETRDIPSILGTSKLSLHLRFGTISIRELVSHALKSNETYLNELIWRDFYQMILFHFPHTVNAAFRSKYDTIEWEHNKEHFYAWCSGHTGYPMVDAGMRELNTTGFMHNRVRMIVASFLCKHLLLDWRLGEGYFAEKLLDFELASNVGGWQWAAGCGCDAAPYFRVFNPTAQQEKFDKDFIYIKKWVPEFGTSTYPQPIIEHKFARERAIQRYQRTLNN